MLFFFFINSELLAIMDGIQNNDAFRHTGEDKLNETWTALMEDLKVWEDMDDHMMYLRRRWVIGSSEWLSGMYDSKQNDKAALGYTDDEWAFIWATLIEDKSWAVPSITDASGNFLKHNDAPEMFIKYIAHDLHCHIIVFDLQLERIQFCSGNHLKSKNVIFDSPLILYNTGGHFQAVFQRDHQFFIGFAKQLEEEQGYNVQSGPEERTFEYECSSPNSKKIQYSDQMIFREPQKNNNSEDIIKVDCGMDLEEIKKIKTKLRTEDQKERYSFLMKERAKKKNRENMASEKEMAKTRTRLATKEQKAKTRGRLATEEQKAKTRARLATEEQKAKTRARLATEEQMDKTRVRLSSESQKEKDNESRRIKRAKRTIEEKNKHNFKAKKIKQAFKANETDKDAKLRRIKNKEKMAEKRNARSELERLKRFQNSVRFGPIFTCSSCMQNMFRDGVVELTEKLEDMIKEKSFELYRNVLQNKVVISLHIKKAGQEIEDKKTYVCKTCRIALLKGKLPSMSTANNLHLIELKDKELKLTEIENNLIAQRILFQKVYQLPKSRIAACKDKLINIPISPEDVINSVSRLPRTPSEAGLIEVKLKRKMEYKNIHKESYVDPNKIYKALDYLKKNGHPDYQFYDDFHSYEQRCKSDDPINRLIFVNENDVEDIVDLEKYETQRKSNVSLITRDGIQTQIQEAEAKTEEQAQENLDQDEIDEIEYRKKDPIRKYQIDYGRSVSLVDKFPEANVREDLTDSISFAPGEGKTPENILQTKNWDTQAFPMKHPDGKNGIDQERSTKLTDQYYFVQRLRNADNRFSEDPAYVFAAAAYLEKKQLQRNVNISFLRGKEVQSDTAGYSSYSLDDGFSVFENISNTPKYWKKAKFEMFAKLDNLGPFHFFFTISCADIRWNENFSTILRKLNISIQYEFDGKGEEKVNVKFENKGKERIVSLETYIKESMDPSYHELLRTHVGTATRIYNNRVKSFMRDIVMDKNNPMCVQFYTTKVEFQGRGAPHNHGTIWVDMKKMEFQFLDDKGRWSDFESLFKKDVYDDEQLKKTIKNVLKDHFVDGLVLNQEKKIAICSFYEKHFETEDENYEIDKDSSMFLEKFIDRFPLYGLSSAFKKFQSNEELFPHEEKAVITFSDKFTTCTLNSATIKEMTDDEDLKAKSDEVIKIVSQVNRHGHTKSCRKYDTVCRFKFPKFPCWKTILSKPSKLKGEEFEKQVKLYNKVLKDVKEILIDEEIISKILVKFPKELDSTREKYVENRQKRIQELLKIAGLKTNADFDLYLEALTYSQNGYSIIQQRDIDEIFVNSYNPEWTRAWNGNTDLQVCLDYFAVITYITEYFTKDDTGMMVKLTEMVKNSDCETLKEKMILLMNTYMTARQMGESEAYYKIFPHLHLKDSNISSVFLPTSRKDQRSKFLRQVDENDPCNGKVKKKIEGKKGKFYIENYDLVDKYMRRDKTCQDVDEISYSHFYKMYSSSNKDNKKKEIAKNKAQQSETACIEDPMPEEDESETEQSDNESRFNFVMMNKRTYKKLGKVPLPQIIKLDNPNPGEPRFMKKRTKPAVLRFHKIKDTADPNDFFFAEALLYTAFRSEEELENRVTEAATDNYNQLKSDIQEVKIQVMEHLQNTEEARHMVEEAMNKNAEVGADVDPEGEQENADCEMEETMLHPDYDHPDPTEFLNGDKSLKIEKIYRPIQVDELSVLNKKTRQLDFYQRKVIEKGIRYAREVVKSFSKKNNSPIAPKVMVHGGAGCGKSTVINILKQWVHLNLQKPGDNPECPYVIVCAPTGTAAANIRGQTLHSSFGFSFSNEHFSLSDKIRDKKRKLLENLKMVIIDEISMMKADQLFQLDLRLREVTQKQNKLFGNVSLFFFGDMMQLKPCKGRYIFQEPVNKDYHLTFSLSVHWPSFEVIDLEVNHRQGDDFEYADMLNRIRVGKQTEKDFHKLRERIRPRNHQDLKGSMFISCKNKLVEIFNMSRLAEIDSELFIFEALNIHLTIPNFKPPVDNKGNVKGTPFMETLKLKKGARIMLSYNIDTLDCLTNGTRGELVDFHFNEKGVVTKIMIKFDELHQGQQRRDKNPKLLSIYPGCTAIERVSFQYSLAKRKTTVSNTAKVIQFPLTLCFAATSHKFQGQTIRKPNKSVADLNSVFQAAQTYTVLSRVESISQVFILDSLPTSKFYADHQALQELERLDLVSINKNPPIWEKTFKWSIKVSCFNI